MDGVVQKRDASAKDAAENFSYDQTERGGHGPAKHRRAQRGVNMTGVTVASMVMGVQVTGMTVLMFMDIGGHRFYSTRRIRAKQPFRVLIRQYDTSLPRID